MGKVSLSLQIYISIQTNFFRLDQKISRELSSGDEDDDEDEDDDHDAEEQTSLFLNIHEAFIYFID